MYPCKGLLKRSENTSINLNSHTQAKTLTSESPPHTHTHTGIPKTKWGVSATGAPQ